MSNDEIKLDESAVDLLKDTVGGGNTDILVVVGTFKEKEIIDKDTYYTFTMNCTYNDIEQALASSKLVYINLQYPNDNFYFRNIIIETNFEQNDGVDYYYYTDIIHSVYEGNANNEIKIQI